MDHAGRELEVGDLPRSIFAMDRSGPVTSLEPVDIVRPGLHHRSTFRQPLRLVIRGSDLIPLSMRKLQLNQIRMPPLLIQQRAGHASKPMSGMFIARVPE